MNKIFVILFLFFGLSCTSPEEEPSPLKEKRVIQLSDPLFEGLHQVVVRQSKDAVYKKSVEYEAYPFNEVLIKAFPDWKDLLSEDAQLILRAVGDYAPVMSFADGFSGRAFLATKIAGRTREKPYDCWTEGGNEHCDLGYFLIWTDGIYPDRPQPWGTFELEVVQFEEIYKDAIPNVDASRVAAGFKLYRKYCIECHQVNFTGGGKATEHVVRPVALDQNTLNFFLFQYRNANPVTYMPDFNGILTEDEAEQIFAYLDHMFQHQNICQLNPRDSRCTEM